MLRPHLCAAPRCLSSAQVIPRSYPRLRPSQIQAAEWGRADALAGCVVDRIGDRGRRGWPRRFAQPAPFRTAGRREDRLDMRMLVNAEQVVGVEVGVDEATAFQLEASSPGM